jgi:hypothetical protein
MTRAKRLKVPWRGREPGVREAAESMRPRANVHSLPWDTRVGKRKLNGSMGEASFVNWPKGSATPRPHSTNPEPSSSSAQAGSAPRKRSMSDDEGSSATEELGFDDMCQACDNMNTVSECSRAVATLYGLARAQIRGKRKRESTRHLDNHSALSWLEATVAPSGPSDSDGEGGEQASERVSGKPAVDSEASGVDVDEPGEPVGDAKSPIGESGWDFGGGVKPPPNDPTSTDPKPQKQRSGPPTGAGDQSGSAAQPEGRQSEPAARETAADARSSFATLAEQTHGGKIVHNDHQGVEWASKGINQGAATKERFSVLVNETGGCDDPFTQHCIEIIGLSEDGSQAQCDLFPPNVQNTRPQTTAPKDDRPWQYWLTAFESAIFNCDAHMIALQVTTFRVAACGELNVYSVNTRNDGNIWMVNVS